MTTCYKYDDNLTDGNSIDADYATHFAELTTRLGYNPFAAGADGSAVEVINPAGEASVQVREAPYY